MGFQLFYMGATGAAPATFGGDKVGFFLWPAFMLGKPHRLAFWRASAVVSQAQDGFSFPFMVQLDKPWCLMHHFRVARLLSEICREDSSVTVFSSCASPRHAAR